MGVPRFWLMCATKLILPPRSPIVRAMQYLLPAAFLALPLVALPLILHLLFRRKSPVVPFPTLRFIRAALQQTAARRRIQRWLLLTVRALLIGFLIWAIAQPARSVARSWFGGGGGGGPSPAAIVLIDTSYSMQCQEQQVSLLTRASAMAQDMLRNVAADDQAGVKETRVLVMGSSGPLPGLPDSFATCGEVLSRWTPPAPDPALKPLSERVAAALDLLKNQSASAKWLIILSDFQAREFPRSIPLPEGVQLALLDLRPAVKKAAGIADLRLDPPQAIPGIHTDVVVSVAAHGGTYAVGLEMAKLDGSGAVNLPPIPVQLDRPGRAEARFRLQLPAERFVRLKASVQIEDAMDWDNQRTAIVDIPPRRLVTVLAGDQRQREAAALASLALDPFEGTMVNWPLAVRLSADLDGTEQAVVAPLVDWPDEQRASKLVEFARRGGVLIVMLRPGLEQSWAGLSDARKAALAGLLPSQPLPMTPPGSYRAFPALRADALVSGMELSTWGQIITRRFVPLSRPSGRDVTPVLHMLPAIAGAASHMAYPLLVRQNVGSGVIYTLTTLPNNAPAGANTNYHLQPPFLIQMVRMCLSSPRGTGSGNIRIGLPIELPAALAGNTGQLQMETPEHALSMVSREGGPGGGGDRFAFGQTSQDGLYIWRKPAVAEPLAIANAQLPGEETDLTYLSLERVVPPGPNVLTARSVQELWNTMHKASQPEPRWSWLIAAVLLLLCLEALLGNLSKLWQPWNWRGMLGAAGEGATK